MAEPKLVRIDWEDSAVLPGWRYEEALMEHKAESCRSVGWLVNESKDCKVIVAHMGSSGSGSGAMAIPVSAIRKIRTLKG